MKMSPSRRLSNLHRICRDLMTIPGENYRPFLHFIAASYEGEA